MEAQKVGDKGEECVVNWFKNHNDFKNAKISWDTKGKGATDIKVETQTKTLLVQVKAAKEPGSPGDLSSEEKGRIRQRAAALNGEAWEAKVLLTSDLKCKSIQWNQLK